MKNKKFKLLGCLLLALVLCLAFTVTALAAEPAHEKLRTDNGDGTYTIELTVKGDSNPVTSGGGGANIVLVYDESSSMTYDTTNSNRDPRRCDVAEKVVHGFLANLAEHESTSDIRVSLVVFGATAAINTNWPTSSNASTLRDAFNDGGERGDAERNYNNGDNISHNGTNWDAALRQAYTLIGQIPATNTYPTFVIMITDGACTASGNGNDAIAPSNQDPWTRYRDYYLAATSGTNGRARQIAQACEATGGAFYGIYAFGTEADLLDDLIYYANEGTHRVIDGYNINTATAAQYDFGDTNPVDNYFNANSQDALNAAMSEIFTQILAKGITSVEMTDSTPNQVKPAGATATIDLLEIEPESGFEYFLTFPVGDGGTFQDKMDQTVTVSIDGDDVTLSWTDKATNQSKTATYTKAPADKQPETGTKVIWDGLTDFEVAKVEAHNVDGTVEWDLNFVLQNQVIYSVAFDVWPSQTTLDWIADLKNGTKTYDQLPDEIKACLEKKPETASDEEADYVLKTNTETSFTYVDSRVSDEEQTGEDFDELPPTPTSAVKQMAVTKLWDNQLDDDFEVEDQDPVTFDVKRDTETPYTVTLSNDNEWAGSVYISIGIMTTSTDDNGDEVVDVKSPGHDFTFVEPEDMNWTWELDIPTVRPVLLDGEEVMLIKVDDKHPAPSGAKVHEINGVPYYEGDNQQATLTATNYRRSSLNLVKEVTGTGFEPDTVFPFTLNIVNSLAPDSEPTDDPNHDSDWWVWISVRDKDNNRINDAVTSGATPSGKNDGWYYGVSGENIVLNVKAGYSIRLNSLPSGSTYTITEGDLPDNFVYDKAEISVLEGEGTTEEFEVDNDTRTATGEIEAPNTVYQLKYTNKYQLATVVVVKEFTGITKDQIPEDFTATVSYDPTDAFTGTAPEDVELSIITKDEAQEGDIVPDFSNSDDKLTYTWTIEKVPVGLNVTVEEDTESADAVDGYTLIPADADENASVTEATTKADQDDPAAKDAPTAEGGTTTLTLTNNYDIEKGYLQITKKFDGVGDDAKLPASVKVTIKGEDGKSQSETITANDDGDYVLLIKVPTGTYTVEEDSAPSISGYKLVKTTYEPTETESEEPLRDETDEAEEPQFATIEVTVEKTEEAPAEVTIANTYEPKEEETVKDHYWLYYVSNGGTEYDPELYPEGQVVNITYEPIRPGYTFEGWYSDPELTKPVSKVTMNQNHTVYAKWSKTETPGWLNDDDHYAYMIGYPDGLIQPNWNITRAEVATIFFRLLREEVREEDLTSTNSFSDVVEGQWFNTAISTVAKMGIVTGYPDGTFKPNANITRAEFATIAARFDQQTRGTGDHFTDLDGHWAKEYIERAAKKGWVTGYPDGTFRPENLATRAEVATLVNRVLNRDPESPEDLLEGMVEWPDNMDTGAWYYLALQEASNTHDYERETKPTEVWTVLLENPDWTIYNH